MKRGLGVFVILLVFLLGAVNIGIGKMMDSAETVTVEEGVSFGDREQIKGLQIRIPIRTIMGYRSRESHLLWDAKITMDEIFVGESTVTLDLKRNYGLNPTLRGDDGIRISTKVSEITAVLTAETMNGLEAVCNDFFETADITGTWGSIVRFNDYFDKYPLLVEVYFDGQKYDGEFGYWAGAEGADDGIANIGKSIDMNLLPQYPYSVQLFAETDALGNIINCRCNTYRMNASVVSVSDVTDTDIYYGADVRSTDGGRPEEIIGEGYGIWKIGYELVEAKADGQTGKTVLFTEPVPKLFWPLEKTATLLEMCISEDQREMLLFTGEDGKCVLSVIDLTTGREHQRLELMEYDASSEVPEISHIFQAENVVAPFFAKDKLFVVSRNDTGEYGLEFMIDRNSSGQKDAESYITDKHGEDVFLWNRHPATVEIAWQDGKLAMVYALTNAHGSGKGSYQSEQPCGFWVSVYDQSGQLYGGEYYLSQGIGEYLNRGNKITDIRADARMGVHWNEGGE